MRRIGSLIAAVVLGVCGAAAPTAAFAQGKGGAKVEGKSEERTLAIAVGESKTLPALDVKQYSDGTPGIADIKLTPDARKFIVTGVKAGTTSLVLIKNDGGQLTWLIKVSSQAPDEVEDELVQLLQGYTGIRVRKIGARLFIEGGVQHDADLARIKQIAELYPGQVESLVTVGTGAVDRSVNIRLDFFFVQYSKSRSYTFGVSWPARIGGEGIFDTTAVFDLLSRSFTSAQAAVVKQPLPFLDIAAAKGWAKVIKQSAVITVNGNEAQFTNGGELNFPIISANNAKIEKIEFGTNVTMQPRFDPRSGNLEVKLSADVADLVPSSGTDLPGRQTTKLSTVVFLRLGESLILSGIKTSGERHAINGIPLLSRIPVLGVFFGSHADTEEDVEGAVFIIPSVVESVPKGSYDMVKAAMAQYDDYAGSLGEINAFSHAPPAYGSTKSGPKH